MRQELRGQRLRRQGGQALILVSLALPMFFAVVALVVDGTNLMVNKRQMQNAADAAALAAAQELAPAVAAAEDCLGDAGCLTSVQMQPANYGPVRDAAEEYSDKNGGPSSLSRCTTAAETNCWSWPYEKDVYGVPNAAYSASAYSYVQVKLERPVAGFFTGVVRWLLEDSEDDPPFDVDARAVAGANPLIEESSEYVPGITDPGTTVDPITNHGTTTLYSTSTSTTITGGSGAVAFVMSEDCDGAPATASVPAGAAIQWQGAQSELKTLATNGGIKVSGNAGKSSQHILLGKKGSPGCEDFYGGAPDPAFFPDVSLLEGAPIWWPVPPPDPAPPNGCASPTTTAGQNADFTITASWLGTHPPGTYCLTGNSARLTISANDTTFNGYTFFAPRIAVTSSGLTITNASPAPGEPPTVFDAYGTDVRRRGVSNCSLTNNLDCAFSMSGQGNSITGTIFATNGTISLSGGTASTGNGGNGFMESLKLLVSGNYANFNGTGPVVGGTTTTTTTTTSTVLTTETVIPGTTREGTTVDGSTVINTVTTGSTYGLNE